jgi:CBS domain-containing protein
MRVQEIMTTKVVSVREGASVADVAKILHESHYTGVPVISDDNRVLGVITVRELFTADYGVYIPFFSGMMKEGDFARSDRRLLPYVVKQLSRATAADIMNRNMFFARPEMDVQELSMQMSTRGVNPAPVTDADGRLLGIVSRSDLLRFFSHTKINDNPPLSHRPIDDQIGYTRGDLASKFIFIARFRANIWLTVATLFFIFGFLLGIAYVVDPSFITSKFQQEETSVPPALQIRDQQLPR